MATAVLYSNFQQIDETDQQNKQALNNEPTLTKEGARKAKTSIGKDRAHTASVMDTDKAQ